MPPKRRNLDTGRENTERWLLTYADLITLLLAFFILMYSMSRVDAKKFGQVTGALNGILRGTSAQSADADYHPATARRNSDSAPLRSLEQAIERRLQLDGLADRITTINDDRGLVIRIMESAAFDPGSADLKPQMHDVLKVLAHELGALPNLVRIEGHSDNTPISTARFPSNWELSTARATGVVRYLVERLDVDPERVSALGYAEYRPVASNATPQGRARNRRVDIIILKDSKGEPGSAPKAAGRPLAEHDTLQEL